MKFGDIVGLCVAAFILIAGLFYQLGHLVK
jgi:hypothetical protein